MTFPQPGNSTCVECTTNHRVRLSLCMVNLNPDVTTPDTLILFSLLLIFKKIEVSLGKTIS